MDLLEEEQIGAHCGLLVESIYQTQNASALSQDDYTQVSAHAPCHKGAASPVLFENESEDSRILLHDDDFCAVGDQDAMNVLGDMLRRRYEHEQR